MKKFPDSLNFKSFERKKMMYFTFLLDFDKDILIMNYPLPMKFRQYLKIDYSSSDRLSCYGVASGHYFELNFSQMFFRFDTVKYHLSNCKFCNPSLLYADLW